MFRKKPDLPPRPAIPHLSQIVEDLECAPPDDPVFAGAPELRDASKDSTFAMAQEFMDVTHRLKDIEARLLTQKSELEKNFDELREMGENIRKQSLQAHLYFFQQNATVTRST